MGGGGGHSLDSTMFANASLKHVAFYTNKQCPRDPYCILQNLTDSDQNSLQDLYMSKQTVVFPSTEIQIKYKMRNRST